MHSVSSILLLQLTEVQLILDLFYVELQSVVIFIMGNLLIMLLIFTFFGLQKCQKVKETKVMSSVCLRLSSESSSLLLFKTM